MPCNKLAVSEALLTSRPDILFNEPGLTALVSAFSLTLDQIGVNPAVTVWSHTKETNWWKGWNAAGHGQVVPIAEVAASASQYVDLCCDAVNVRIYADGKIELRDGWIIGYNLSPEQAQLIQDTIAAVVNSFAIYAGQQAVADAFANTPGVTLVSDEITEANRTLTIEI